MATVTHHKGSRFASGGPYCKLESQLVGLLGPTDNDLKATLSAARKRAFEDGGILYDPDVFRLEYLRSEGHKRYTKGTISAAVRQANALEAFEEGETLAGQANARLVDCFNRASTPPQMRELLLRARNVVAGVLGPYDGDYFARMCSFSGGASTEFLRSDSHPTKKWGLATHITRSALPYYIAYHKWAGLTVSTDEVSCNDLDRCLTIVRHNTVFTVPKNYEKDRTCAKEPTWNMFFQKGLGALIRSRLQRRGLLLPDAQQTHQGLARLASRLGHLATLDLSMASDTVSLGLVELLFPEDWLQVVLDLRVTHGRLPSGREIAYEKVSSMGNGFTFEIETLIFYALARAVAGTEAEVSVYGDDIIVPSECAGVLTDLLAFAGFRLNSDKSFAIGPFRESCGGHYFDGHDVTPFYVESAPRCIPEVIDLHNRVLEWAERDGSCRHVRPILDTCRKIVPRKYWGPRSESGVLWAPWDKAVPTFSRGGGPRSPSYNAWTVRAFHRVAATQRHDYFLGGLIAALTTNGISDPAGTYGRVVSLPTTIQALARNCAKGDLPLEHSVMRYVSSKWKETRRVLRVDRQWTGPSVGWD